MRKTDPAHAFSASNAYEEFRKTLADIEFASPDKLVSLNISFSYSPRANNKKDWIDILSLRKSDIDNAFAIGIETQKNCLCCFFGDGSSVVATIRIDLGSFLDKKCFISYRRTSDFSVLLLSADNLTEARFASHPRRTAASVSIDYFRIGSRRDGVILSDLACCNDPNRDLPIDAVADELLSRKAITRNSEYYKSLNCIASHLFARGDYAQALRVFKTISNATPQNIEALSFTKARTCIGALYNPQEARAIWKGFSTSEDALFGDSLEAAKNGDLERSNRLFRDALNQIDRSASSGIDAQQARHLLEAHRALLHGSRSASSYPRLTPSTIKKVIVSGTGWSGSGAVYDYLREFDDIVPIRGETPYIEGSKSLRTIYEMLLDDRKLREQLLAFYYYALLGYGYYESHNDFKLFRLARRKLFSREQDTYIQRVLGWCTLASSLYAAPIEERERLFIELADYTVNNFSIGTPIPAGKQALLDNVVHIGNAECINFLSDTSLLCTFRDPRSNYVALIREAGHFIEDVETYIRNLEKKIVRGYRAIQSAVEYCRANDRSNSVEVIQFEEFVLSETSRRNLIAKLCLSAEGHSKHAYFRPWESARNVFLHQEHPNQEEIELIGRKLGRYCYDPCIRRLTDKQ